MSEPYFYPDKEMLSDCCGALSATEIVDGMGICSDRKCRDWASFKSEEEYEKEEEEEEF